MPTASKDSAGWIVSHTIDGAGEKTITFKTENRFIDSDARVTITTPSASNPSLTLTNKTGGLSMGTATSGVYSPEIDINGTTTVATAGWIAADDYTVSASDYKVGTVNQSLLQIGQSTIASGSTITPGPSEQTITITEGYNSARTLTIGSASSSSAGSVTSGSATIDSLSYAYVAADQEYTITGAANVSAPTVETAGYVSGSIGTLNPNTGGATVNATVPAITLGSSLSGTTLALQPSITKQTITTSGLVDASSGVATTEPVSGAYVAIRSTEETSTITAEPTIEVAGYGSNSNFIQGVYSHATVGAAASETYYVPIKSGTITSGSATISSATFAYNSSNSNFAITGSANVSAPTFTEGYIASTVGTKNANTGGATLSATVGKIAIQANLSGTGTKKPSITKNSSTNIPQAGSATTTKPSSGYYIAVSSAANTGTVQATASVTTAGYGTTTSGQYTTTPSSSLTVGAAASSVTYVPITTATFANSATSGTTYTDISSSAPILISGDYLYINAGYTPASKISLARLVPDASGENAAAGYILSGYTAYDNDGVLIVGTLQTYDGSYTIT